MAGSGGAIVRVVIGADGVVKMNILWFPEMSIGASP